MLHLLAATLLGLAPILPAAPAPGQDAPDPQATPAPLVDPGAFRTKAAYDRKRATIVEAAAVRTIVPGTDKDGVYRIVGTPTFGETITHRFNYVLELRAPGEAPLRCRMQLLFGRIQDATGPRHHIGVTRIIWQTQACADRSAEG